MAENIDKIARDITKHPLELEDTSEMTEVFIEALSNLMVIPGDWFAI